MKICQVIFEDLDDESRGYVETMYDGGLGCLFTKTLDEIWNFFEYLAHDTWEYDNARETFCHPILDPYMMHSTPLDESQIEGICYEHSHSPCAHIACDYYGSFDYDVDTCPLLCRPHRLGALTTFNREMYLQILLKTDLSLALLHLRLGFVMNLILGVRHRFL